MPRIRYRARACYASTMPAPLIGVSTSVTVNKAPERAYVNTAYLSAVQQAGGVPVLLAPGLDASALRTLWERLDGLLLTGGGDIHPARLGEPRRPTTDGASGRRAALELCPGAQAGGRAVPPGVRRGPPPRRAEALRGAQRRGPGPERLGDLPAGGRVLHAGPAHPPLALQLLQVGLDRHRGHRVERLRHLGVDPLHHRGDRREPVPQRREDLPLAQHPLVDVLLDLRRRVL